ncbi:MAG TPA: hypothetical protein VFP78_03930 [Solirubrobacteraceae bacterium]|nr:hypothetical protein [Solirubrobacteraceae bacterium]
MRPVHAVFADPAGFRGRGEVSSGVSSLPASSCSTRAAVVVAAELELGVAGVAQHFKRAGHVELVVGQQVTHREDLNANAAERDVAARPEAVVLIAVAPAATVAMVGPGETRIRAERPHRRRSAGGTDEAPTRQRAPDDHSISSLPD